jgi:glycosyltransferase involved in cell wall biosynthesis
MDAPIKISVIIPAKNEEKYIKRLLDSLVSQTYKPFEIIIADANSTDNTAKIAVSYHAKIVKGGLPAKGRNEGAKVANGDYLFFLDADTFIEKNFIETCVKQIIRKKSLAGTAYNIPIYAFDEKGLKSAYIRFIDRIIYFIHNFFMKISSRTKNPLATGTFMYVKREIFVRSNGFDESLVAFEDAEFAKRLSSYGNFDILKNTQIFISTRRFDKKGRFSFPIYIGLRGFIGRKIFGEKRKGKYF